MKTVELRDREEARAFVLQGLLLSRLSPVSPAGLSSALALVHEVATSQPLPPHGFVADLANGLLGPGRAGEARRETAAELPVALRRPYEDYVLGKLFADASVERAGDALRRYRGRDLARGLSFVVEQARARCDFDAAALGPALLKGLLRETGESLLRLAWQSLRERGLSLVLLELYESLIGSFRRAGSLLGPEDLFELEHGTALQELGQRVALRQVLTATEALLSELPRQPNRPLGRQRVVPTSILDEDTYPVGGYSSLSTRGSVESLLYSQLAYMEKGERPDLFDVKFLRDELLYYSRDENRFLRRRRSFVFALFPDLVRARFKDEGLPWQRIVFVLALVTAVVRRLTEWLSADALLFEVCFVEAGGDSALGDERRLLELLLREPLARGTVRLTRAADARQVAAACSEHARRSECHCLTVSTADQPLRADQATVTPLLVGKEPELRGIQSVDVHGEGGWSATLAVLLNQWAG
jgi:hypothetical protein